VKARLSTRKNGDVGFLQLDKPLLERFQKSPVQIDAVSPQLRHLHEPLSSHTGAFGSAVAAK
jgi:hypothetical protein